MLAAVRIVLLLRLFEMIYVMLQYVSHFLSTIGMILVVFLDLEEQKPRILKQVIPN